MFLAPASQNHNYSWRYEEIQHGNFKPPKKKKKKKKKNPVSDNCIVIL